MDINDLYQKIYGDFEKSKTANRGAKLELRGYWFGYIDGLYTAKAIDIRDACELSNYVKLMHKCKNFAGFESFITK